MSKLQNNFFNKGNTAALQRFMTKQQKEAENQRKWTSREDELRKVVSSGPEFQSALDFDEFGKFKDFAYGTEDSPYAALARQRIGDQTLQGLDQVNQSSQQGLSSIYDQLAMGGGLSGGARERLAGSAGEQALMARQGVRQSGVEGERDLDMNQADQRMGAQEKYMDAVRSDNQSKSQFELDRWKQRADTDAAILKSQTERDIAAANSCLLEGTLVRKSDGNLYPIDSIKVGDELPGGIVYTIQQSLAPNELYNWQGVYMTGGHAVSSDNGWIRCKDSELATLARRPAGKQFIYNLGVTKHYIELEDGLLVGDLHETDLYEYVSDEQSLEMMNEKLPLRAVC